MGNIFKDSYIPKELRGKKLKVIVEIGSNYKKEESIELIYYLKCEKDIVDTSKKLAIDETTGKWIGKGKPSSLFKKCYLAAKGGVKFIKDDEKMLSPSYCNEKTKIKLVSEG
jgi:ribulose 1,5-bisphosphate carboxylase large subunit-like protein